MRRRPDDGTARVLLRYRYRDGSAQAAFPMWVVADGPHRVAWLPPGSQIMYWALADGSDPRSVPLETRFDRELTTAPRTWQGPGILRVMPSDVPYQVLHFWHPDGAFAGWYVNFETPGRRSGDRVDAVDWHLDLWIDPDGTATWKDEDEAAAALAAGHMTTGELRTARSAGQRLLDDLPGWLDAIGDWRAWEPPAEWTTPLPLPDDWDS